MKNTAIYKCSVCGVLNRYQSNMNKHCKTVCLGSQCVPLTMSLKDYEKQYRVLRRRERERRENGDAGSDGHGDGQTGGTTNEIDTGDCSSDDDTNDDTDDGDIEGYEDVSEKKKLRPGPFPKEDFAKNVLQDTIDIQNKEERAEYFHDTPEGQKSLDYMLEKIGTGSIITVFLLFISHSIGVYAPDKKFKCACTLVSPKNKIYIAWKSNGSVYVEEAVPERVCLFLRDVLTSFQYILIEFPKNYPDRSHISDHSRRSIKKMVEKVPSQTPLSFEKKSKVLLSEKDKYLKEYELFDLLNSNVNDYVTMERLMTVVNGNIIATVPLHR